MTMFLRFAEDVANKATDYTGLMQQVAATLNPVSPEWQQFEEQQAYQSQPDLGAAVNWSQPQPQYNYTPPAAPVAQVSEPTAYASLARPAEFRATYNPDAVLDPLQVEDMRGLPAFVDSFQSDLAGINRFMPDSASAYASQQGPVAPDVPLMPLPMQGGQLTRTYVDTPSGAGYTSYGNELDPAWIPFMEQEAQQGQADRLANLNAAGRAIVNMQTPSDLAADPTTPFNATPGVGLLGGLVNALNAYNQTIRQVPGWDAIEDASLNARNRLQGVVAATGEPQAWLYEALGLPGMAENSRAAYGGVGEAVGQVVPVTPLEWTIEGIPGIGTIPGVASWARNTDNLAGGIAGAAAREALPELPLPAARAALSNPMQAPASLGGDVTFGRLRHAIAGGAPDAADEVASILPSPSAAPVPDVAPPPATAAPAQGAAPPVPPAGVPPSPPSGAAPVPPSGSGRSAVESLLGLEQPAPNLTLQDQVLNSIKSAIRKGTPAEETVTPLMRERARALGTVDNQAARLGAIVQDNAARAFSLDPKGRILSLPYAPTIQDVAAKLPDYQQYLTPEQVRFFDNLKAELDPYRRALDEVGRDIHTRGDIIDGGFYLPRGNAAEEGADEAVRYTGLGARRGGKGGFEKSAKFDSMWQGIDAGYEYSPIAAAVEGYVKSAGRTITDQWTASRLLSLTDDAGEVIAQSAADRINPVLRDQVTKLREQIHGRIQTLARQTARQGAQEREVDRVMRLLKRTEDSLTKKMNAVDAMSPIQQGFKRAEAEMRILDRMANRIGGTAQDAAEAGMGTRLRRSETLQAIRDLRKQLDGLSAEWDRAKRMANETPRGQGRVDLPGLQGYSFPEAMSEAVNKELRVGATQYAPAEVVKEVNSILRMMSATLDMSGIGIQLALAATDKPRVFAKSVGLMWKSLADPNVTGAFLRQFDDTAKRAGLPTSADWARNGLRVSGVDTEFTGGRSVSRIGQMVQNAPGAKQANRAFGTAGDVARMMMAQDEMVRRKLVAGVGQDANMQAIATAINRATGVGKGRFLGDVGEVIQFAPRYFNSQLEILTKAATDTGIEGQVARRQLMRLFGAATVFTVAANEALGNEYDYISPIKDGRMNSNFMRIRFAGQDASLLGPWDSLMRAVISTAGGDKEYFLRTKASPVVARMWDAIAGENFIGESTDVTTDEGRENFMRGFLPFSAQGVGSEPPAASALNALGIKSAPLSLSDKQFEEAQAQFDADFKKLTPEQQAAVNLTLVQKGETLERWRRAAPYEDARETAFREAMQSAGLEYETIADFKAEVTRRVLAKGGTPDLADDIASKLVGDLTDDRTKEIRFRVIAADPDMVASLTNPSKEIRAFADEVRKLKAVESR